MSSLRGERTSSFSLRGRRTLSSWRDRLSGNPVEVLGELPESKAPETPGADDVINKLTSKNKQLNKKIDDLQDKVDDLEFYKAQCERSLDSYKTTIKELEERNNGQQLTIQAQQVRLEALEKLFSEMNERGQRISLVPAGRGSNPANRPPAIEVTVSTDSSLDDSEVTPLGVEPESLISTTKQKQRVSLPRNKGTPVSSRSKSTRSITGEDRDGNEYTC